MPLYDWSKQVSLLNIIHIPNMKSLFATALLSTFAAANQDHFAVLVAGSSGWWNYRHQADVHHAYNIMIKNGIPAENIVVFCYDDIASSPSNPFPG